MRRWSLFAAMVLCGGMVCAQAQQKPIRVWGWEGLRPIMLRWESVYSREHPEVRFQNVFHGAAAAPAGLYDGVADIVVMGREWWPVDNMAFHWVYQYAPFGVGIVAAGTMAPKPSFTPVVIVNAENPLRAISLAQLDAVFGCEHKAAPANVRQWSELGVRGALAGRAIVPMGFGEDEPLGVFFRKRVLKEDYKPNPTSVLLQGAHADVEIADRVARDAGAIGYTSGAAASRVPGVKVIPAVGADGAPVEASAEEIEQGRYPLARTLSVYVNRKPGERLAADLEGFLLFVLSDAGQSSVRQEEGFLPLPEGKRSEARARVVGDWTEQATSGEWKQ